MGVPWGKIIALAGRIISAIAVGVPSVETIAKLKGGLSGAEKKQTVLTLIQQELSAAELALGHDLAHDEDVIAAAGEIIDAYVALQNLIARKALVGAS